MPTFYGADISGSAGKPTGFLDRLKQWAERARNSGRGRFEFAGKSYAYLSHSYNSTWRNERTVEIPIALAVLERHAGERILELGNVLSFYSDRVDHDVIDKYEPGDAIIDADVVDFQPTGKYDLIISVSTLEHVGWDEPQRDREKTAIAVEKMASWLQPGGELFITFPVGHNDYLDDHLRSGRLPFDEVRYLQRVNRRNVWREVDALATRRAAYGAPFPNANVVAVGISRNS